MSFSKDHRKVTAFILTLALIFSTAVPTGVAFGAENDITGHWAETTIQNALATGYVSGYPDGTFRPNDPVTRAEFVTMVNSALGLREENTVNLLFEDVAETAWYYDEVQKASYAQYVSGVSDTQFLPEALITRQEAATMLSRFLPSVEEADQAILSSFSDTGKVSSWAKDSMIFVIEKGYISGYEDKTLRPLGSLTRAEAVQVINQILQKETIIREDTSVKEAGAILSNAIYVGDITVESSVGSGDVDFTNLSALSKVYIYGGGTNTVTVDNSLIIEMIVGKVGSAVRVQATGKSDIKRTFVLGSNLVVDETGEVAKPQTGSYEEIVKIQGTTSQLALLSYVKVIEGIIDQRGKIDDTKLLPALGGINKRTGGIWNKDGSLSVVIPRTSVSTPSTVASESISLSTIDFCGTSHAGIGAFTTIASITENGVVTTAYAIYTEEQLQHLALHLNANAILMNDLDFTNITKGAVGAADPNTPLGALSAAAVAIGGDTATDLRISSFTGGNFTPIGTSSNPYIATFYGNNKVITGLTISGSAVDNVGIFGSISGAAIKDLTSSGGSITGENCVGGVVGWNYKSTVRDSYNTGAVSGDSYVGGVVGCSNSSTASAVHNTGAVSGDSYVGGVVGFNECSTVTESYNAGSALGSGNVGGVVGYNSSSTVSDSYNTGAVSGTGDYAGGVVGHNDSDSTVSGSYNTGTVTGRSIVGGVVGKNFSSTVSDSYNMGNVSGTGDFVGGIAGKSDNNSMVSGSYNTGRLTGSQVGGIVGWNNDGSMVINSYNKGEITLSSGSVAGGVVGNNNTNCTVSGVYNTGSVSGTFNIGGIVGYNYYRSTVANSYNTGAITGTSSNVGGVVGFNDGNAGGNTISDSYNTGAITGNSTNVGGIVGYNNINSSVNGSWLEGTNLTSRTSGIGSGNDTTTTFSAVDTTTLSAIYASMSAIATSAGGVAAGAITAISFSGVDTPPQFSVLQGAYITSASSLTLTVSSVTGTTVTAITGTSISSVLSGTGEVVSNSITLNGLSSGTWILIRAVNTDAKLNRNYFVYVKR